MAPIIPGGWPQPRGQTCSNIIHMYVCVYIYIYINVYVIMIIIIIIMTMIIIIDLSEDIIPGRRPRPRRPPGRSPSARRRRQRICRAAPFGWQQKCTPEINTSENIMDFQWHFPMKCQLHFPMKFHCCDFWCVIFCPHLLSEYVGPLLLGGTTCLTLLV